eukprot:m.135457 g.135457  ORF g.135457 m.135457 type:complete len:73 (+) comp29795_c0_seq2:1454-1672(+)
MKSGYNKKNARSKLKVQIWFTKEWQDGCSRQFLSSNTLNCKRDIEYHPSTYKYDLCLQMLFHSKRLMSTTTN